MNAQAATPNGSLLVVDDEEVVCRSCARIFERQGFQVETSTDPREGLRLAKGRTFSAILLDIMMPELSGIEWLEQLRATNPSVPVIIITGYSSIANAAEAMRLRAADYIPKPFTPDEISDAVARALGRPGAAPPVPAKTVAPAWEGKGELRFHDVAWAEPSRDGAALRVGTFVGVREGMAIEHLRAARVGDEVVRGLPLAELTFVGARRRLVPAPASGVVVELNEALLANPTAAFATPGLGNWIARLVPTAWDVDQQRCARRTLVLATGPNGGLAAEQARLANLGCDVKVVTQAEEAVKELGAGNSALLVDADALAAAGPELVRKVRWALPEARIVVWSAGSASAHAGAYRAEKILYHAVAPVPDHELVDLAESMFRARPHGVPTTSTRGTLPTGMSALRIINRNGENVTLLSHGGALQIARGLGQRIIQRVQEASFPIRVTLGAAAVGPTDVGRAAEISDRIVLLEARDIGRIPGTLVREASGRLAQKAGDAGRKCTTLAVQPAGDEPFAFDELTLDALASAVVAEMAATR
jgi:DNA-binding response OmpR family regulator